MPSVSPISSRVAPHSNAALMWNAMQSSQRIAIQMPSAISSLVLASRLRRERRLGDPGKCFHDVWGAALQTTQVCTQNLRRLRPIVIRGDLRLPNCEVACESAGSSALIHINRPAKSSRLEKLECCTRYLRLRTGSLRARRIGEVLVPRANTVTSKVARLIVIGACTAGPGRANPASGCQS
jgi:hypothetical protein